MVPPKPPRRILVICIRRLGDVLLSTALIRSLKLHWPQARIDVLVNASSAVTLQGNPDIETLLIQPDKPRLGDYWKLLRGIFRRYDLAVCTLYNDRPFIYALLASGRRAAMVPQFPNDPGYRWKRRLTHYPVAVDNQVHAAEQYLRLADALSVPRMPWVVPPQPQSLDTLNQLLGAGWQQRPYAVLHPTPLYRYKAWPLAHWRELALNLISRGMRVCLTGGPSETEQAQVAELAAALPPEHVSNLCGKLRFAELTPLIAGARVFVGPDTSVSHLAAATGAPTIALFGPTPPTVWAPWPQGYREKGGSPWSIRAPLQHKANVWLVQGITPCMPCGAEGCDRHLNSRSLCLDQMPASRVIAVADQVLGGQ